MENPDQLFLLVVKVFCMVVMFLIIMITGSIPYKSEGFKSNPKLMSLSSAFSGGLFIAVGMIHLLPEAVEKFETFCEEKGIPFKPFP